MLAMKKEKKLLLFLALVLVGVLLFSSVPASAGENPGRGKSLAEARKTLEQELLPLAGAGFVGITHSEAEGKIIVFVENEQAKQRMPCSFEGYAVRTEVTGKIQAFSTQVAEPLIDVSAERRSNVRPLVGGISLSAYVTKGGGYYLYAGTLGMVTYNNKILSNAHVIAMNPDTYNFLNTGTPIIQSGSYDGGGSGNRVGELQAYININFSPNAKNYADAAIGSIDGSVNASPGKQFSETGDYWIGGWTEVSQGDTVRKSGRTTGVTTGNVLYPNVSVEVSYGSKSAYFEDQIVVTQDNWSFAQPGDSGSAVDKNGKFVGLLFAGSAGYAVICKAKYIIDGLSIDVEPPVNQYSLTISSTPGGNVTEPGVGTYVYSNSTVVNLTAVPDTGYQFVGWTGNATTIANPTAASTNITMNDSYSITANFALEPGWYSLTISSTPGGNVTEPGVGTYVYGNNTVVNLVAVNYTGYQFVRWTGNVGTIGNVSAAETTITMNGPYYITANFGLWQPEPRALLTLSSTRDGSVTTPGEGTFLYPLGANVPLVAVPDEGGHFVRWLGDVGTIADIYAASTTITMDNSYSVRADFSGAGGCFIATAAYGTPMAEEIQILRQFRDEYLLTNAVGRALVGVYYKVSPPIAEFITEHPNLKPIVRAGLLPAVAMSTVAVNTSPVEKAAIIGLLALVSVAVAIWATRRRSRGPGYI
jgi:uncharacterized repeat protein (TIGR02543 family)